MNKSNLKSLDTVERASLYSTWNLSTRPDSLNEIKIDESRDRNNLLFCVMQK